MTMPLASYFYLTAVKLFYEKVKFKKHLVTPADGSLCYFLHSNVTLRHWMIHARLFFRI